jgi:hypothetical protein
MNQPERTIPRETEHILLSVSILTGLIALYAAVTVDLPYTILGTAGFLIFCTFPLITAWRPELHGHRLNEIFFTTGLTIGGITVTLHLLRILGNRSLSTGLFLAGTAAYWFWSVWLYATKAEEAHENDGSDRWLRAGMTPVYGGGLLGPILLLLGVHGQTGWAIWAGLALLLVPLLVIGLLLRSVTAS